MEPWYPVDVQPDGLVTRDILPSKYDWCLNQTSGFELEYRHSNWDNHIASADYSLTVITWRDYVSSIVVRTASYNGKSKRRMRGEWCIRVPWQGGRRNGGYFEPCRTENLVSNAPHDVCVKHVILIFCTAAGSFSQAVIRNNADLYPGGCDAKMGTREHMLALGLLHLDMKNAPRLSVYLLPMLLFDEKCDTGKESIAFSSNPSC